MKTALFATVVLMFAAGNALAVTTPMKDPRQCTPPGNIARYGITPPRTCAQAAVQRAIVAKVGPIPNLSCQPRAASWLVWRCVYGETTRKTVTVTFRPLASGWHVQVR